MFRLRLSDGAEFNVDPLDHRPTFSRGQSVEVIGEWIVPLPPDGVPRFSADVVRLLSGDGRWAP